MVVVAVNTELLVLFLRLVQLLVLLDVFRVVLLLFEFILLVVFGVHLPFDRSRIRRFVLIFEFVLLFFFLEVAYVLQRVDLIAFTVFIVFHVALEGTFLGTAVSVYTSEGKKVLFQGGGGRRILLLTLIVELFLFFEFHVAFHEFRVELLAVFDLAIITDLVVFITLRISFLKRIIVFLLLLLFLCLSFFLFFLCLLLLLLFLSLLFSLLFGLGFLEVI